jgi:hypothetical protein
MSAVVLQRSVKPSARKYDHLEGAWEVHYSVVQHLLSVIRTCQEGVDTSRLPPAWLQYLEQEHVHDVKKPLATLHLLPTAPIEVIKAAYKALCLLNHPDHGGDIVRFREIDEAYQHVMKFQGPTKKLF